MRRLALLSDIHGNLEALEAVLRDVEKLRPEMVVVLGDTINYGPDPRACLERVDRSADLVLAGNHEKEAAVPEREGLEGDAREMLEWTVGELEGCHAWEKLRGQILEDGDERSRARLKDLSFVHGSAAKPVEQYVWPGHPQHHLRLNRQLDEWLTTLRKGFRTRHAFCGHTHVPAVLAGYEDREIFPIEQDWNRKFTFVGPHAMFYVPAGPVRIEGLAGRRVVINPGSVGQPRDDNPAASWALYDGDSIEFRRVPYDSVRTGTRIRALPLSEDTREFFADRLEQGV
ncbi:MAG TPA: metallophosphoesterase [Myxococcales bacterium]|jgi:predicted phosphodiesterase